MSMLRSPNGGGIYSGYGGGSQPNLSTNSDKGNPKIAFRHKLKLSDDSSHIMHELSEMRKQMSEMMSLITLVSDKQTENINKICQDVTAIKRQVSSICTNIDIMNIEQEKLKSEMTNLVKMTSIHEKRIEHLETNITILKASPERAPTSTYYYNDIIAELEDRNQRAKNIIITGIPETYTGNFADSIETDKKEVIKLITTIISDCPEPKLINRLGKHQSDKPRPIKVCFASKGTAALILRNKSNVKLSSRKVYSDQTLYQREAMRKLKSELEHRIANGEKNLIIKFIKGVPKIRGALLNKRKDETQQGSS